MYLIGLPIGNARDVTLRALDTLAAVDAVACEDTRVTGPFLRRYGIKTQMVSYHEHNADRMRPQLLSRIAGGQAIALVSDAGMPLISDPGYKLVRAVVDQGDDVTCLPGASAPLAGLLVSGLPTDRFLFVGFLPTKRNARRKAAAELTTVPATLVLFESPRRLADSLGDLAEGLGDRQAAVARELTKRFEEVRRGSLVELAAAYRDEGPPRGEVVVVIAPPDAGDASQMADSAALDAALIAALAEGSLRDATASVAAATGLPRRTVYRRALALVSASRTDDPA